MHRPPSDSASGTASGTASETASPSDTAADLRSHLPLSPADCHILMALAREELYGYALLRTMDVDSSGVVRMDVGALYRALDRLMRRGLIEESERRADEKTRGKPRRYYRLRPLGQTVLRAEMARLRRLLELAELEGMGR